MKTRRSKLAIKNANELNQIIEQRQNLQDREKTLKEWFASYLDFQGKYLIDGIEINFSESTSTKIDRKAIERDHGKDFLKKYIRKNTYNTITVRDKKDQL